MSDEFSTTFEAPIEAPPEVDALVAAAMRWHFSPATGSPYWVNRKDSFGFDPLVDVRAAADLRLFDTVTVDWSQIPAHELIPSGSATGVSGSPPATFGIYESGGTTGAPKRIVDGSSRRRNVQWLSRHLDEHQFPVAEGGWLHIGPTGPHIMAKNISNLAAMRHFLCYFIDVDPRWVRRCISAGRRDDFRRYVDHILDQVVDVLATQDVRAVSTTPPILEAMAARSDVYDLVRGKVKGILWGGTSMGAESLRLFEHEVFPEATIAGAYGNTMMGVAPQRASRPGDQAACTFQPFHPYTLVEVVDPGEPTKVVSEDAEGQVKITVLTRDLFVPPTLERDIATRRSGSPGYGGIELSDVRPRQSVTSTTIEGVY